ncbi:MAG: DnaD domain protein [Tyzzerella sp.]|nr:DnaD domain protein [Tyzzerella sp.]
MRTLTLRNRFQGNSTIVENDFIDNYMVKANGEYVKVYLLLLRHLNAQDDSLTISNLADCLECTEKDILRALKHWSKVGLLKIDYDEAGTICGLAIGKASTGGVKSADAGQTWERENILTMKKPSDIVQISDSENALGTEEISDITKISDIAKPKKRGTRSTASKNQDKLRQLYFVAEQYMGKPLSVTEIQKINYFFDTLNFSTDLIEYLIEYCVETGHKSMHYIETVALAWADKKITTVTEARENTSLYHKNCFAVMKAFGITGRNPAPIEVNYIKKWTDEYGFTLDIVLEACNRTITNTSKPDFKYADSILTNWLSKDVHHLADITRLDFAHQQERTSRRKAAAKPVSVSNNRFNNFESRSYDITSLEQQLLNTQ